MKFENQMDIEKTLYIIAGANGSGKTTFALSYIELNNLHFINADEIAKSYDPNDISKYKVKAGKEFFRQLELNLNKNQSFMIESTLSGRYLKDVIIKAKEKGFKVVLIYIFLESEIENILSVIKPVCKNMGSISLLTKILCSGIILRYYEFSPLF